MSSILLHCTTVQQTNEDMQPMKRKMIMTYMQKQKQREADEVTMSQVQCGTP